MGLPSTIHSATALPTPGALDMPVELSPEATKKFLTSGASPMMNMLSGVKLSAPTLNRSIPACSSDGIRSRAASQKGLKWSQSGSSRLKLWSSEMPSMPHGFATGSKPPMRMAPSSWMSRLK